MMLENKRVLVTGGTGSLGQVLVRRLLAGEVGKPHKVIVFSRDEAKQHYMRMKYMHRTAATDEVIFRNFQQTLEFRIGDVRDYASIASALRDADIVVNAAAIKQVPTCEYFPSEAVHTNVLGAENIVRAIREHALPVQTVVGVSTDKACKPVNAMGMTKAIQERIFIAANVLTRSTRFLCVRYGNVLASRGSVVPLFHDQIQRGGPVTITSPDMTRFLLSIDEAVDTIFAAIAGGMPGDTYIPRIPAARVIDLAALLIGDRKIKTEVLGVRPGEKLHEILVSEEECFRTVDRGNFFAIRSALPELHTPESGPIGVLNSEYSSADGVISEAQLKALLEKHRLMVDQVQLASGEEFLR
jgi:FlaA1/EpsC-like NDP-sugar epimerase